MVIAFFVFIPQSGYSLCGIIYVYFWGGKRVKYRNGKELLPAKLLRQLQELVEGELIYIPRKNEQRAGWGAVNGARMKLEMRNHEIDRLYRSGISILELSLRYNLSEDGIRKVLQKVSASDCNELKRC